MDGGSRQVPDWVYPATPKEASGDYPLPGGSCVVPFWLWLAVLLGTIIIVLNRSLQVPKITLESPKYPTIG